MRAANYCKLARQLFPDLKVSLRELGRVVQEEDMGVVGDDVPVSLIGLQLVSETR